MIQRQNDRSHVAWDIETTGFGWSDRITVSGFWFPGGYPALIINTDGGALDRERAQTHLEERSGSGSVSVTVVEDEPALLEAVQEVLFKQFDREYNRLVAFNAESWQGGFDLPFLRTRCFRHGFSWLFDGIQFADLWDPLKKRINTTHVAFGSSSEVNSLTGAHELLFNQLTPTELLSEHDLEDTHHWYQTNSYDPFADSGSAVERHKDGEYLPILQHNLADIHRTWELGELVRSFISSKDLQTKKL